jgi:uncharacterized protein
MKPLHLLTLSLVAAGAINWGLVGLFQLDLVAAILGGSEVPLARGFYLLVGVAGLYHLMPLLKALGPAGEEEAYRGSALQAAPVRVSSRDRTFK